MSEKLVYWLTIVASLLIGAGGGYYVGTQMDGNRYQVIEKSLGERSHVPFGSDEAVTTSRGTALIRMDTQTGKSWVLYEGEWVEISTDEE